MSEPVSIAQRLNRIHDALLDLSYVQAIASVAHIAAHHQGESVVSDMPAVLHVIETMAREAGDRIEAAINAVQAEIKAAEPQPAPAKAATRKAVSR